MDKIIIGEIDIDMEKAIADTIKLREQEASLKKQMDEIKKSQGTANAEYIQASANLKAVQTELRSHEGLLVKTIQTTNLQTGSMDQLKTRLAIVSKQWSALSEEERKNSDIGKQLTKQKLDLTNQLKKEEAATGDNRRNVGNYTESIKEAQGSLNTLIPGFGAASGAAKSFGIILNLSLLPITATIAAIAALVAYFKRSEEGQNSWAKVMAIFNVYLQNFLDVVSTVGEYLFKAVTKPKEAWQDFKDFVKGVGQFFKDTFGNVIGGSIDIFVAWLQKAFANVGLAWQKLKGIFVDNSEKIKAAQQKIVDFNQKIEDGQNRIKQGAENLKNGIVNAYNKIKEGVQAYIKESEREAAIAARLADQQAALDKRIRKDLIENAKIERDVANLRAEIAQKDKLSGEERLKRIDEANILLNKQMNNELNIAKQRAYIHSEQIKLSNSTKEDLDEQARLEAEIIKIQTANAEKRRAFERQRSTAFNEMLRDQIKASESAVQTMQYELDYYLQLNKDKLIDSELTSQKQIEILTKGLEQKIALIDAQENVSEEAKNAEKLKLTEDYNLKVLKLQMDFEESERVRKLDVLQTNYDNELQLAEDNLFSQLEIQRKQNELKRQEEIRTAEKIGADVNLINKKYAKADRELEKAKTNAKLSLAAGFASNIATIAGENTKVGKAAAAAAATINTYQAATGAYASLAPIPIVGPALGIAAAAAAVVSGIQNVRKILSTQPGQTPAGESFAPQQATTTFTSQLQNVNTDIGQGIVSREVASGQAVSEKTQSVLVVDKVTDEQTREQNKVETSAI